MARAKNLNRMIYKDRKDNRIARQVARRVTTTLEKRKIEGYSVTLVAGKVIVGLPDDLEGTKKETLIDAILQTRQSELIEFKGEKIRTKNALDDDEVQEHFAELLSKYLPKETKLSGIAESGTLTLVGKVSNAHAKEAAVDLANRTQGVSKVIDNLRIPYSVGDIDLANSVIFELGSNRDIKVYHLQVFAKSGHIFLSGNAGDKNSITLAENTAEKVSGVKSVSNGIRLHGEGENSDDLLTKKIEAEIKKSQDVRARDVKVTAIDGYVFLKGYAKNTAEIIAAESLVSKINGVKRLYMELEPRV